MFDIGAAEMLVLLVLAVFIFGPDRLPDLARQAAGMLRTVRRMAANARADLGRELGTDLSAVNLADLHPRTLVQRHVLDVLDEEDEPAAPPGRRPLVSGEQPPYDTEAT